MRKIAILCTVLAFSLFVVTVASAQIKGFFDKEEPDFRATILPTEEAGTVLLVFYFTHSKINALEGSLWMKDQGTSLSGSGEPTMLRGLQTLGNRQQDTLRISGLKQMHFYTFGIDYKTSTLVTSKFESKVLVGSYRYEYVPGANAPSQPTAREELATKSPARPTTVPCQNPDLYVQVDPNGYCAADDRPAIRLQCQNCTGTEWTFSVELRNANTNEDWRPLRTDGRMQIAAGNAPRTEPLCTLRPGVYYARVLAQGENCSTPVIHNVNSAIAIADRSVLLETTSASQPSQQTQMTAKSPTALPDTCVVMARAGLYGNTIRGTVELAANSPCGTLAPFAEVHYVHPGYRDIAAEPVQLRAGAIAPFEIVLDERDLKRSIQPIQVVTYVKPDPYLQPFPMGAFWIKAGEPAQQPATTLAAKTPINTNAPALPQAYSREELFDTPSISQDIETISVRASDPNCTPIQELSLVYMSGQPDKPLYISWLNPRCCQSEGCRYSIWAGETPDRLKLLIEGSKRGAVIKELLPDMLSTDHYIEIVVNTSNGNRKAAYVLGEGPKYGIEEILAYRDRLNPQKSDPVVMEKTTNAQTGEVSGDLVARGVPAANTAFEYAKPQNPISDFQPCKYERETLVLGDKPIEPGKKLLIQYDFSDKNYRYTLYFQPEGNTEWVLAPGTSELQKEPRFDLDITPYHAGKYIVLVRKANSTWGCLATTPEKAVEVKVVSQ